MRARVGAGLRGIEYDIEKACDKARVVEGERTKVGDNNATDIMEEEVRRE